MDPGTHSRGQGYSYGVPSNPSGQTLFEDTGASHPGHGPPPPAAGLPQMEQLLSNPVVAQTAMHYGQGLVSMGQQYLDSGVSRFAPGLKQYFAVDTGYVLHKLQILLCPYIHKDWSLQFVGEQHVAPRRDVNAPDLYIPVMGFVTYVLLTGLTLGTQKRYVDVQFCLPEEGVRRIYQFTPEELGVSASSLLAWLLAEVVLIWVSLFLARVSATLSWLDILAYCGYKYISMIVSVAVSLLGMSYLYYGALCWTTAAIAYFEVQTLRLRVQPDISEGASRMRNYVLLVIAMLQPLLVLWLTWGLVMYQVPPPLRTTINS